MAMEIFNFKRANKSNISDTHSTNLFQRFDPKRFSENKKRTFQSV